MTVVFTQRELDMTAMLWEHGPSTVAEVRSRAADPLRHDTVATMLSILETKGYAGHSEEGRAFRYHSLVEAPPATPSAQKRKS